MCRIILKERFYQKNTVDGFDKLAINAFENYSKAKEKIFSINDKIGIDLAEELLNASEKYIYSIAKYNSNKIMLMDPYERQIELENLSTMRKSYHNSLISKINPTKRYFESIGLGNIFKLPETSQLNRSPATVYASRLVMGKYLITRK